MNVDELSFTDFSILYKPQMFKENVNSMYCQELKTLSISKALQYQPYTFNKLATFKT